MSDLLPEPEDLAVITADDELLDRLAMGGAADGGDDDVAAMLAAWRDDIAGNVGPCAAPRPAQAGRTPGCRGA